jgi:ferritin-like metal-binding protein YciE
MDSTQQKLVQYLNEAHATEIALVRVLQSQIAMTPRGTYRTGLEKHLRETRDHARRVQRRLKELDAGKNPVQALTGAAEALLGQALALAKTPLDLVRGSGGEEKVLKNARDASATEALEIATYLSIERAARAVGDDDTAKLAASIRADEERMLAKVLEEIPKLTDAVVGAEVNGDGSYDIKRTGAADAARAAKRKTPSRSRGSSTRSRSRSSSRSSSNVPIARYDDLTADEIVSRLAKLSESDRSRVRTYERSHKKRATVIEAAERKPADS